MKDKEKRQPPRQQEETGAEIPLEEQMVRRQSAPQPTAQQEAERLYQMQSTPAQDGAVDGFKALTQVIGREEIQKARLTLQKYKEGKANLEQKVIESEQWYKLRNWECMRKNSKSKEQVEPASAWLFNSIANKHADAMDNFPTPNILPREEGDKEEAEMLSSIIPVILQQNEFEETYDVEADDKLRGGTGVYGVFWDKSKLNGLGDIAIEQQDILSLFWQPGVTDIQRSRHFFHVDLIDNDVLISEYPQLEGKLGSSTLDISQYIFDDTVDTTEKSAVIDWYYKKRQEGRTVLHYCKFVNDEVLFATENEPEVYPNGWYEHGMYPYVFDPLFRMKGTPCGFGYIDVGKSPQEYIDRGNQAILMNMLANAKPRHFIRTDGSVNEQEYADMTKDFVHVDGNLGQDSIMPIQGKPLNNVYVQVMKDKVDELKETTGNRDISTGGTSSGVTAASAIAAMQEAGSKLSRDNNKASYRAFRKVVLMVIELIRQFYDLPRCFRILGENGAQRYVEYSNAGIKPQPQGTEMGVDLGYRVPLFDVEITAQKQSPYSKMSQNELALQFYTAGFFNPQMADQALACLDMMDFDRKQFIMQKIATNGTMYQQMLMMQQQMLQLAQIVDQTRGTNLADQIAAGIAGVPAAPMGGAAPDVKNESLGGEGSEAESSTTRNARKRVAESTSPT
jgi:hypothetical protein